MKKTIASLSPHRPRVALRSRAKVERYSSAVSNLKNLLSWWDSLGEVQKASREMIAQLVQGAELIINQEQFAWSTPKKQAADDGGSKSEDSKAEDSKA